MGTTVSSDKLEAAKAVRSKPDQGRRGRIFFVNRYFYPDHSATSQLLSDVAFDLAQHGRDVCVVASRLRYDDPQAVLAICERIGDVTVQRVWSTRLGRLNLFGRALDYFSFYGSAGWTMAMMVRRGDVIVAKTDPPLISVVAGAVAAWRGALLVNWLQDLFPEVATGLLDGATQSCRPARRIAFKRKFLDAAGKWLQGLRDSSLRQARCNVVIGEAMRERLLALGIEAARIRVVHNWADGQSIRPVVAAENPLRKEWNIDDQFVVGYSGNLGRAHEIDTLLAAMEQLRGDARIVFLFIGGGARMRRLQEECRRRGLFRVLFKPYQARENLRYSLSAADVHLILLQPQMEGLIVPSKFYGIAAAGRPSIYIGAAHGEIPALLRATDCGVGVRTGEAENLATAIRRLAADPLFCNRLGENARRLFEQRFEQGFALRAWRELLAAVSLP
ncbi:MAG: glycosyltransferase family 4 protein [Gammaproteobacteria bacterium]